MSDGGRDQHRASRSIPTIIATSAALSWRLLVIIGAIGVLAWIIGYLSVVTIPVAIALLLSALFSPVVAWLVKRRVPGALATAIAVIGGLAVVGGVLTLVITTFSAGLPQMQSQVGQSIEQISNWLRTGPLHLSQDQLQSFLDQINAKLRENTGVIASGAITTVATVGEVLTGMLLALFTLIFFLHDGTNIWSFVIKIFPSTVRGRVNVAGRRGFLSLVHYVRATVVVAFVDAIGIGIGLWIVGVPLAVPLAALVFLGAFVPIVGAVVAGTVAVLVALVAKSFLAALIVLAIVIAVMQLEGHVLQPVLLGRAVKLHPLAVVLSIATGIVVGGIPGALLAVPVLAVLNSGIRSLLHDPDLPPESVAALPHRTSRRQQPDRYQPTVEGEQDIDEGERIDPTASS